MRKNKSGLASRGLDERWPLLSVSFHKKERMNAPQRQEELGETERKKARWEENHKPHIGNNTQPGWGYTEIDYPIYDEHTPKRAGKERSARGCTEKEEGKKQHPHQHTTLNFSVFSAV